MKKVQLTVFAFVLCLGTLVFGQTAPDNQGTHEGHAAGRGSGQGRGAGMMNPDAQLERMSRELNLTDDQKTKIKPILQDTMKQMQQLHEDSSLSEQDKRAKVEEVHKNAMSQVRGILTPDQQKKFEAMHDRRGHGAGRDHDHGSDSDQHPQ